MDHRGVNEMPGSSRGNLLPITFCSSVRTPRSYLRRDPPARKRIAKDREKHGRQAGSLTTVRRFNDVGLYSVVRYAAIASRRVSRVRCTPEMKRLDEETRGDTGF